MTNVKANNKKQHQQFIQVQYKSNFTANDIPVKFVFSQADSVVYSKDSVINFEEGKSYSIDFSLDKIDSQA